MTKEKIFGQSPNVILFLLYQFINGAASAIWSTSFLTPYLYSIIYSSEWIGYSEGAQGIFRVVFAFPAAYVADKFSRGIVVRAGLLLSILTIIVMLFATNHPNIPNHLLYWIFFTSLVTAGIAEGLYSASLLTLFSDSIATGQRTKWMTLSDTIIASGMTIKFFPLFFEKYVHLDPVGLQVLYVAVTLALALGTFLMGKIAAKIGRIQTTLPCCYLGVTLLFLVVLGEHLYWNKPWIICTIFTLRTMFMNVAEPLLVSIMNDYAPKETRARWNTFSTVASFGWSGSAVLGGYMIDTIGYGWTFSVTLFLQLLALLPYWILLFLVSSEEHSIETIQQDKDNVNINTV